MKFPWNGVVVLAGFITFMALETILHSHGDSHNTPEKRDHKQQHQISSGTGGVNEGLPKLYPGNRGTRFVTIKFCINQNIQTFDILGPAARNRKLNLENILMWSRSFGISTAIMLGKMSWRAIFIPS